MIFHSFIKQLIISVLVLIFSMPLSAQINIEEIEWQTLLDNVGRPLTSEDIIVVEHGNRLVINASEIDSFDHVVKGILIYGELHIIDGDNPPVLNPHMKLKADWVLAANGGVFKIGSEAVHFRNHFELTLSGDDGEMFSLAPVIDQTTNYISTSSNMPAHNGDHSPQMIQNMIQGSSVHNYSFLMAMGDGSALEIHAVDSDNGTKRSWTQLARTLEQGQNRLDLHKRTYWQVGDRIVVASTDFDHNQAEVFTINAVSNDGKIVYVDRPASYMHYGESHNYNNGQRSWNLDMRGEVGLLNRRVKIKGDVIYDPSKLLKEQEDQYGGHTMVMMGASMKFSGVEFEYMGQAGKIGRYPTHWHMLADGGSGQYIEDCSFHHTFNKGITVHGTHNTLVKNNVVYENIGHGYFLEDGGERDNAFIQNLCINSRQPRSQSEAAERDDFVNTSNFWIENNQNSHVRNHAAGSDHHGYFFSTKGLNGLSNSPQYRDQYKAYSYPEGPRDQGRINRVFFKNSVHSASDFAFGLENRVTYVDVNNNEKYTALDWSINKLTIYKSGIGLWVRGVGGDMNEVVMGEVEVGTRLRLNQGVSNSLIVGRTPNVGNPQLSREIEEGRTLPWSVRERGGVIDTIFSGLTGHQLYDGPAGVHNVYFTGFSGWDDVAIRKSNAAQKSTMHYVSGLTFGADTPLSKRLQLGETGPFSMESRGLVDIDGSLTGIPGAMMIERQKIIVQNSPRIYDYSNMHTSDNWLSFDEWSGVSINPYYSFGSMLLRGGDFRGLNTRVTHFRSDSIQSPELRVASNNEQSIFVIGDHYTYKMELVNAPDSFEFYVNCVPMDESVIYEIEGINFDSELSTRNSGQDGPENRILEEMESLESLRNHYQTAVYRDAFEGRLFIKFVAEMNGGWDFPQPRETNSFVPIGGINVVVNQSGNNLRSSSESISLETQKINQQQNEERTLQITPNPAHTNFKLDFDQEMHVDGSQMKIMSLNGTLIKRFEVEIGKSYDISELTSGIYFVVIQNENQTWTKRLIKN